MKSDALIKHGWHWSFGWLRRSELDQRGLFCFESPDGELLLARNKAVYLDCHRDVKTGELYVCPAPIPRKRMTYVPPAESAASRRNAKG